MNKNSAHLSTGSMVEPIFTVLVGLGYTFSFIWVVEHGVAPHFEYMGYTARLSSASELVLAAASAVLLCLLLPSDRTKPSSQALAFLLCTVGLPLLFLPVYYGALTSSVLLLLQVGTVVVMIVARALVAGAPSPIVSVNYSSRSYSLVLTTVAIAIVGFLVVFYGLRPEFVSLDELYDRRDEYGESIGRLGSYLMAWLVNGILATLLAVGIGYGQKSMAVVGILGFISAYSLTGFKSYLVGMALVLAGYVVVRILRAWRGGWFVVLTAAVWTSFLLDKLFNSIVLTSLFVRRAISTGGANTSRYFEYFTNNERYHLRHSVLSFLGESPYPSSPASHIGAVYSASGETIANANIVADGYANFGIIGCVLAGLVIGLFLRVYDSAAIGLPISVSVPALALVLVAASNTAVLTMLLTHGGLILILLIALIPKDRQLLFERLNPHGTLSLQTGLA